MKEMLQSVVSDFVASSRMFTAFEVSIEAKARGVGLRHREMRETIHQIIFEIAGQEYSRILMDVGAPDQTAI